MEQEKRTKDDDSNPNFPLFHPHSRRLHIVLLCMTGFFFTTFMRIHLSLTMTCMVNSTASFPNSVSPVINKTVIVDYGGSLVWSQNQQNLIFSGTFWGSLVTVLPSMFFIQRFSPRHVLQAAVATYILVTVITPFLANEYGYLPVFIARVVMGFAEGFIVPCNNAIIGNWFPSTEKSTALALFTTGNQLATAGGNPLVAAFCDSRFGWTWIFYSTSALATIWSLIWFLTASNHPSKAKMMSDREKDYLMKNVVKKVAKSDGEQHRIPYRKMLTSPAFLAQLQCQFVVNLIATFFQTYLPTYLKEVLYLGVMANGTFTSIPNVINIVFKMTWGFGIDKLKQGNLITNTTAVKLSHGFASFGSATALLLLALFVDSPNPTLALILFCFMYCCQATFVSGFYTSLLSLAPQYTATMSSISMTFAMMGRLSTPVIASVFRQKGSLTEWQNIFYGLAVSHFVSGSIFIMFGSGELQNWDGRLVEKDVQVEESDEKLVEEKNE